MQKIDTTSEGQERLANAIKVTLNLHVTVGSTEMVSNNHYIIYGSKCLKNKFAKLTEKEKDAIRKTFPEWEGCIVDV